MEREFEFLGSRFDDRGARFEEYLQAIREIWTADDPHFDGQYVRFSDVNVSPRPMRPGGSPIWIGGGSRRLCAVRPRSPTAGITAITVTTSLDVSEPTIPALSVCCPQTGQSC